LVTIVGNLVDNAFDVLSGMSADDGQRRVQVSGEITDDDGPAPGPDGRIRGSGVLITVTDTGPGLTQEQAAAVFRRGWSTKTARGPAGDRGLGLALVAQAVARCGGTVIAEPGRGARFLVWLPYQPAHPQRPDDDPKSAAQQPFDPQHNAATGGVTR
jgi:signal transduction histidine kinase